MTPSPSEGWLKRFLNPKRLACADCSVRSAIAIRGLLLLLELSGRGGGADALLELLVEQGIADQGEVLRLHPRSHRVSSVASHGGSDLLPAFGADAGIVDYVIDCGMAIGCSRREADGVWRVACTPLVPPGQVRTAGCLYLERRPGASPFDAADLDLLLVLGRSLDGLGGPQRRRAGGARERRAPGAGRPTRPVRVMPRARPDTAAPPRGRRSTAWLRRRQPLIPRGTPCRAETRTSFRVEEPPDAQPSRRCRPLTLEALFPEGVPDLPNFD